MLPKDQKQKWVFHFLVKIIKYSEHCGALLRCFLGFKELNALTDGTAANSKSGLCLKRVTLLKVTPLFGEQLASSGWLLCVYKSPVPMSPTRNNSRSFQCQSSPWCLQRLLLSFHGRLAFSSPILSSFPSLKAMIIKACPNNFLHTTLHSPQSLFLENLICNGINRRVKD